MMNARRIEIVPRSDGDWELLIDGCQSGQYTSKDRAKAAARRHISSHEGLRWDGNRSEIVNKRRRSNGR